MTDQTTSSPVPFSFGAPKIPPASGGGPGALVGTEETSDVYTIYIPAAATYNTTTSPIKISYTPAGLLFYVQNNEAVDVKIIGTKAGDPGVAIGAGSFALCATDTKGGIVAIATSSPSGGGAPTSAALVRGMVDQNVPSLAAFAVTGVGRDGLTYVAGDLVLLSAQTTVAQNGPYVVGTVGGGNAPLTRPSWWAPGASVPSNFTFYLATGGTLYGDLSVRTIAAYQTQIIDTNDPLLQQIWSDRQNPSLSQAAWFVDANNGVDTNSGSAGSPVQTLGEIAKRWGPTPPLRQSTTVTVVSTTLLASDIAFLDGVRVAEADFTLILRGTVFAGATLGAITAVSAISHSTADGALYVTIGAITWPAARTRVRISGGARDGAVAYVETPNTAAGQARLSPFSHVPAGTVGSMSSSALVTPQAGDVLIVETVSRAQRPLQIAYCSLYIVIEDMRFDDDSNFTFSNIQGSNDESLTFNRCSFGDGIEFSGTLAVFNSGDLPGLFNNAGAVSGSVLAALVIGFFGAGALGYWILDLDTIFSGCSAENLVGNPPADFVAGNVAFYGVAGACVVFNSPGKFLHRPFNAGDAALYGTGNQYLFKLRTGSKVYLQDPAKLFIVGTTSYASINGVNITTKLYPQDNKDNLITTPASDPTTITGAKTYPIAIFRGVLGCVTTNVANLAAFAVAANDGNTYVQGNEVLLLAQTVPAQNGPYIVGVVVAGNAPLVRPDWWQTGMVIPSGITIASTLGTLYSGTRFWSSTFNKIVDTDDPVLIPDRVVQNVLLVNGTVNITNVAIRGTTTKVGVFVDRTTPVGTAATIQYSASTITGGQLGSGTQNVTVQAQIAAGTINAADGSNVQVTIVQ